MDEHATWCVCMRWNLVRCDRLSAVSRRECSKFVRYLPKKALPTPLRAPA